MANRTYKNNRRKKAKNSETAWIPIAVFLVFIAVSASIFFQNMTGILGNSLGKLFFYLFGIMAYILPVIILLILTVHFFGNWQSKLGKNMIYIVVIFFAIMTLSWIAVSPGGSFKTSMEMAGEWGVEKNGPGLIGGLIGFVFEKIIGKIGIILLNIVVFLFFILHLMETSLGDFLRSTYSGLRNLVSSTGNKIKDIGEKDREDLDFTNVNDFTQESKNISAEGPLEFNPDRPSAMPSESDLQRNIVIGDYAQMSKSLNQNNESNDDKGKKPYKNPYNEEKLENPDKGLKVTDEDEGEDYVIPPIDLLNSVKSKAKLDPNKLKQEAATIERTLSSFGIESEVVSIQRGPTVALFELKPAAGIKVSRITNLADDLALALAAKDIRIEAPIPGKPYVGIEVPNSVSDAVSLRQIISSDEFRKSSDNIPIALGQSIDGHPVIAEIAKMPHLLIAGATGSGKSVCINTMLISMLYKYSPKDLRMILIDPKVVELSVYNGIPHLLIPVVTDPKKASRALYMGVQEMERRFKLFSKHSVRDIAGWKEKEKVEDIENLPYIVIVVDELSDLMMASSKDVEAHITRLAQMARACGMHLIIATQRPSVDVITGTIKANVPSRISFQVSSAIDSRTILDQSGAERLLGKGDMLYYPANFPKPSRVQGAFVSESEVSKVIDFIKDKHSCEYDKDLIESIEKSNDSFGSGDDNGGERDELMDQVLEFISHEETTSISGLQRRFRIGYARAGRIIDDLEAMGAVSPQDGSKPREVRIGEIEALKGDDNESGQ